jgi:hypothetical protein
MLFEIVKNSVSNYPSPMINCTVNCFLNETEKANNNPCYWIPFNVSLTECIGLSQEAINQIIIERGTALYNAPEMEPIFQAIELGVNVSAPEVVQ